MPAFSVSRSTTIDVPPEAVFEKIVDLKSWPEWSPWLISEPNAEVTYADDGKSYSWNGEVVGSGNLEIVSENPSSEIDCKLTFFKPFKSEADVKFLLEGENDTKVSWIMDSSLPFFLFFMKRTMITMIGMDYERGLEMLKSRLETGQVPSKLEFGTDTIEEMRVIGVHTVCSIKEIGSSMERDMGTLHRVMEETGLKPAGPPMSVYHHWSAVKGNCEYTIGVPVGEDTPVPDELDEFRIPPVNTYSVTHTGPYQFLGNAWSAGFAHQRAKKFASVRGVAPFEIYQNDPEEVDENELITVVHFPMK